jgi:TRAP-type mannitol/chloroaromatic compound transport system substrate-binding protein
MKLRKLILLLPIFLLVLLSATCTKLENGTPQDMPSNPQIFEWQMMTVWPKELDILTQGIEQFIEDVRIISNDRLNITLADDAGGLSVFDAVSSGKIKIGHSVAYLWTDKIPAAQFMASVPFGMDARQHLAWLNNGDGLKLWRKLYHQHNLIPFPMGNTGMQMGGWFNKPIEKIDDFEGLKIRLPGLAGEVLVQRKIGAIPVQKNYLVQALKNDSIDAVEWMGPYYDKKLGLHKAAKSKYYYYYPGWHEPGTTLELLINRQAWEKLPDDLQKIIEIAANNTHQWIYTEFESKNAEALQELESNPNINIKIRSFPDEVLTELRKATEKRLEQKANADRDFDEVYKNYREFQETMDNWRSKAQKLNSE